MTNEEAIRVLKEKVDFWKKEAEKYPVAESDIKALDMAIEALKAQRWIPCSERSPKKSDDVVLVTVIDERRIRDIYLMRCDEVEFAYIQKWISAWMPLPEPYKEEP